MLLQILALVLMVAIKIIGAFIWLLFIRAILSLLSVVAPIENRFLLKVNHVINVITNVLLIPISRIVPNIGMLDLSFLVCWMLLVALQYALSKTLLTVLAYS